MDEITENKKRGRGRPRRDDKQLEREKSNVDRATPVRTFRLSKDIKDYYDGINGKNSYLNDLIRLDMAYRKKHGVSLLEKFSTLLEK